MAGDFSRITDSLTVGRWLSSSSDSVFLAYLCYSEEPLEKNMSNRVSGASFISDDEFVVIRLGDNQNSIDQTSNTEEIRPVIKNCKAKPDCYLSAPEPQIRRITMKKSNKEMSRKKDSIASLVVDTKDSLKAPLIVETLDLDNDIEDNEAGDEKMRAMFLSKGDLPRSLRSTRRLSAFNEQLYEEQQLFLSRKISTSSGTPRPSVKVGKEVKAASCDAISDSRQEQRTTSTGHKSVQVIM